MHVPTNIISTSRIILTLLFLAIFTQSSHHSAEAASALHGAKVLVVNDGDTITPRFNWKDYKTRLIGIDAPELGQWNWGKAAKERMLELMDRTEWYVFVETDVERRDKYGRLLAYIWTQKHELVNELMVLDGLAVVFTIPPNVKYRDRFERAEQKAKMARKGIWGPDGLLESPSEYRRMHPRVDFPKKAFGHGRS